MPIVEEQRSLCEDLERLEQACADRLLEQPKTVRDRLARDHTVAKFVDRFQQQSTRLLETRRDVSGDLAREIESLTTHDPFEEFYRQLEQIKDFHRRYPNEPVENLERAYKRRQPADGGVPPDYQEVDNMFTGEEAYGRFFDLTQCHEEYLNLPGVKRITYLQYLAIFDRFANFMPNQRHGEKYFQYLTGVANYLESFLRRTQPLENPDAVVAKIREEFGVAWEKDDVPGWGKHAPSKGKPLDAPADALFCEVCEKAFQNKNVYDHHFNSKKHKKAAESASNGNASGNLLSEERATKAELSRLKDRAIAEREWRVTKLAEVLKAEREATATNVERKQALTERERQMELEALMQEATADTVQGGQEGEGSEDEEDDSKIYNPLKLPLAWDGKPIPYWLYKLHGLGVEFPCEICGNFVYMGRRAFDKHFNESRHIHGLRCLGITNTTLFREITKIDEAQRLWEKLESDKKKAKTAAETVEEMEDAQGNVMPRKVFEDLQKQGLL